MRNRIFYRSLLPMERSIVRYVMAPAVLLLGIWLATLSLFSLCVCIAVAAYYVYLSRPQRMSVADS